MSTPMVKVRMSDGTVVRGHILAETGINATVVIRGIPFLVKRDQIVRSK